MAEEVWQKEKAAIEAALYGKRGEPEAEAPKKAEAAPPAPPEPQRAPDPVPMPPLEVAEAENPQEEKTMDATEILKTNFATAVKTTGANQVNKTLIDLTKKMLREKLGVDAAWMETPLGNGIIMNLIPTMLVIATTNPMIANALPAGVAERVGGVATLASAGAMNEVMAQFMEHVIPMITELASALPAVEEGKHAALPAGVANGAMKYVDRERQREVERELELEAAGDRA